MTSLKKRTADSRCPIHVAARRSGLSVHVIRAWERRYHAIAPGRSSSARRVFSEGDIRRLVLLRQAVQLGHLIGNIAHLPSEELYALVVREAVPGVEASPRIPPPRSRLVEDGIAAARELDSYAFIQTLLQATRSLTVPALFEEFVAPLMQALDPRAPDGRVPVVNGRFAAAHLRTFLGDLLTSSRGAPSGPIIVCATPRGQHDETEALMSAITAIRAGWDALYLGCDVAATEICRAVVSRGARAMVLSLADRDYDARLEDELVGLRKQLPAGIEIFIGGSLRLGYDAALHAIRARRCVSLQHFGRDLDALRAPAS